MLTGRIEPRAGRIREDILEIARFVSRAAPGYTRISFSGEDREAREYVRRAMDGAGLSVRVDAAGNMIGKRDGGRDRPAILVGSHLDTVEGGGRFDGVAGVVAAIETARRFDELRLELAHPLEIVVFLAEEPSPFGLSTIGSRGMTGRLSADRMTLTDRGGRLLADAIAEMGGDPARLTDAARSAAGLCAYVELHIEQGPHLASAAVPVGVVTGIAGIWRGTIEVSGRADHAGTAPMGARRDALAAASEVVLALETVCAGGEVVGTVGRIEAYPNSLNVVPGNVKMGMEMRGLGAEKIDAAAGAFRAGIARIREKRGVEIAFDFAMSSRPVRFPEDLVGIVRAVCEKLAVPYIELPSWAGHDANHLAEITPAAMIFVPSREGRSHCAEEWTDFDDICVGTEVLASAVWDIDRRCSP